MKNSLIKYTVFFGSVAVLVTLYQLQLGAISFFLLAIYFFNLAYKQLFFHREKKAKQKQKEN